MTRCDRCGRENPDDARFCNACGAPLAVASTAPRQERKVVTVVFADLVGSTARAERLDPEDVRAVLAPYHARLRRELERHGGTVEKFIGDAVVAVFGAPVAHEDDPERAVRSALAIQEAIVELNEADPALDLQVRIGVNTGEVLVALDAATAGGEGMVSGDVVNTCARLQAAAPPGGVLVGDATYRATDRMVEYREADPVVAKGKSEPIRAWQALQARARFGVDLARPGGATLVGRERELDALADALARVRADRAPELVTLVGVPGIGKSRLVWELFDVVERDPDLIYWRQGRCLPYGDGVTFWALGEMVKAHAGILETDTSGAADRKLADAVAALLPDEREARWVEGHLRPLAGLASDVEVSGDRSSEAFAAWRRFLEAVAEERVLVLVFEDLHWADDGLLDFVDALADRVSGVPLLVLCSARPELLERRPGWGGGKRNAVTLSLSPLTDEDTARLIAALLDRAVLPAETQSVLLQRAAGNPLYAEEYVRMLADHPGGELPLPETVHGIVAARVDLLPADEKGVLQAAAVLGKVFWGDALSALSGRDRWELDELLHSLERKEFVVRERRSAVAGEAQYAFRHVLVRDVAYGQLPRPDRAEAHRRVAEWIDSLPSDREEDRADMLAHHLVEAVEYGRAAGHDVTGLVPEAGRALREAGDRAWALGAPRTALGFYERSRELDPVAAEDPYFLLRLGRLLLSVRAQGEDELERAAASLADTDPASAAVAEMLRGEVSWQRGDSDGATPHFERAATLVDGLPVSHEKALVVSQLARFRTLAGHDREAWEPVEQAIAMATELGDTELLGDALNTRAILASELGGDAWVADLERSLALALEANSWRAGRAYVNLGSRLLTTGHDLPGAEAYLREGIRFAEQFGSELTDRWLRGNLADCVFHLGGWDEGLRLADAEIGEPEPHYQKAGCRLVRARIRLARGDALGAVEDAEAACEESRAIRDPQALVPALVVRAFCLTETGNPAAAEAAVGELARTRASFPSLLSGDWMAWLALALLGLGRPAELFERGGELGRRTPWRDAALAIAADDLVPAADTLAAAGARTLEAQVRLVAARSLSAEGRRAEAGAQLADALAFFRSVGATRYVSEGEALLAEAS